MGTPPHAPTIPTHKQSPQMCYFMTRHKQTWKHLRCVEALLDSSMATKCHVRIVISALLLVDHISLCDANNAGYCKQIYGMPCIAYLL